jgi:hypothetical protein
MCDFYLKGYITNSLMFVNELGILYKYEGSLNIINIPPSCTDFDNIVNVSHGNGLGLQLLESMRPPRNHVTSSDQ